MATDADVRTLIGLTWPVGTTSTRCVYCRDVMLIAGAWHPSAGESAYVVLACAGCHSSGNGGAP